MRNQTKISNYLFIQQIIFFEMFRKQAQKSFRSGYLLTKSTQDEPGLLFHITMKQHSTPNNHLLRCQFEKDSNSILLSDLKKNLLRLNLSNLNYTPLLIDKVSEFEFYSYDNQKIYVASSENQSKLYLVNSVNKRWQKFNLNINKIVSFQINILRNLILVADPVILNVIDERTKIDNLVYRPPKSQTILKAAFTANNRSLTVLLSNMNIKQLGLQDMAEQFSIFLPFEVIEPSLEISGNNRYLVVAGANNQVCLITGISQNEPVISVLRFPFKVKSLKFDLDNNLVVLGRDQIVYYYRIQKNQLQKLYNSQNQHVIHSFDISLDNQHLCCISNFGTIFIYGLKETLSTVDRKDSLESKNLVVTNQIYQEEQQASKKDDEVQQNDLSELICQLPTETMYYHQIPLEQDQNLPKEINDPKVLESFRLLKYKFEDNQFFNQNAQQIAQIIYAFQRVMSSDSNSSVLFFLRMIKKSQILIHKLSLVLCPEIIAIVQKRFNLDFQDFVVKSTCSLFLDYFDQRSWIQIVKFLIKNKDIPQILQVFFLLFLKQILPEINKSKTVEEFEILLKSNKPTSLQKLFQKSIGISKDKKYDVIFKEIQETKVQEQQPKYSQRSSKSSKQRIKQLLQRQDELQESMDRLNSKRGHLQMEE